MSDTTTRAAPMSGAYPISTIDLRFSSGNDVPVTRAFITDVEWSKVRAEVYRLREEDAGLRNSIKHITSALRAANDNTDRLRVELDALRKQEPSHYAVLDDNGEILAADTSKRALLSRGCAALGPTVELYAANGGAK